MARGAGETVADYIPRRTPSHFEMRGRAGTIAITRWGPGASAPAGAASSPSSPASTPIMLLHGWMDCGPAWQLLVDCLPDDWPLLAIDWPGYGRSERHAGSYWFPEHFAELDWLLDEYSPQVPARLIGHSMGGTVASMYAGIRPARVAWLVNMEGFGMPAMPPAQLPGLISGWLDSLRALPTARHYADLDELAVALRRSNPHLPPAHARFLARAWTRPVAGGYEMLADPRQQLRTPIRYGRAEVEACWTSASAPQLLLYGEESAHARNVLGADGLGADGLARMRQLMPALAIEPIARAGHLLPHEQPQGVAQAIVRFAAAQA